ncbi:Nucleotide-binding universal stress protein, UspA family [Haladaptatus litoreus]|uniref:Nucleotide-binding universal stress protein, UspA family n=1 Tax=Haladaptatus litoreus TaxID=553468 RepID=A0A1N7E769_9EURY|nr:universal stress protein [Haladaptatus litoreus]SIR83927.1 Nucleotide-binding universal stress protein, UspA family [Haladaptatus litoreus]
MYERILLPTDGSDAADRAIEQALNLAETYDARLYVISIVDQTAIPPDVRADILYEELQEEGERAVDDIEQKARDAGIDVRTSIPRGTPYRAILDFADDHDVDLIVMGTHGRRGIDRYLLGSVTEKVVRLSERPVLTVRMDEPS